MYCSLFLVVVFSSFFFLSGEPSKQRAEESREERAGGCPPQKTKTKKDEFFTEYCVHYTSTILYPVKKKLIGKISKYTVNNKYVVSSEGREGGRKEEELSINKIFKF